MFKEIQKVFVKVLTLDWHDYRSLEQGIMTYIILGLESLYHGFLFTWNHAPVPNKYLA